MKWHFVMLDKGTKNQGWWLKITTFEELSSYWEKTSDKWSMVLENYLKDKTFHPKLITHGPHLKYMPLTMAVVLQGERSGQNHISKAIVNYASNHHLNMYNALQEYGAIYINKNGGWHMDMNQTSDAFVYRSDLVFPSYTKNSIKVLQFPNGDHFYAYLDDMQVRDGNKLKWNTYKDAYEYALSLIME